MMANKISEYWRKVIVPKLHAIKNLLNKRFKNADLLDFRVHIWLVPFGQHSFYPNNQHS